MRVRNQLGTSLAKVFPSLSLQAEGETTPCLRPDVILVVPRRFETKNKRFATMFMKGEGGKMKTYPFSVVKGKNNRPIP